MKEIEVKILNINRNLIEERLINLKATQKFNGLIYDAFYDFPDGRLKHTQTLLRLRRTPEETYLTSKLKGQKNPLYKCRTEYEVTVSAFETLKAILKSLNLHIWLELEKKRTSYVWGNVSFEFDTYVDRFDFIPCFLEIEASDTSLITDAVSQLNLNIEDCKPWSIHDIVHTVYPEKSYLLNSWHDDHSTDYMI